MFKCSAVDIIMSHKSQLVIIVNYIITDTYYSYALFIGGFIDLIIQRLQLCNITNIMKNGICVASDLPYCIRRGW